jgi:hypothetical protein
VIEAEALVENEETENDSLYEMSETPSNITTRRLPRAMQNENSWTTLSLWAVGRVQGHVLADLTATIHARETV